MRNMSFMLTKEQFRNQTKRVTRRLGWWNLKRGEIVMGVEKSQGLKKGERIVKLGPIRIVTARREKLRAMTDRFGYGLQETRLEVIDDEMLWNPNAWVKWFCASHKGCTPETEVNRIEFEYVDEKTTT